jgi:hypothetical protein
MKCKLFGMGLGLLFHLSFMFLKKKLGGNIIYLLTSMKDKKMQMNSLSTINPLGWD